MQTHLQGAARSLHTTPGWLRCAVTRGLFSTSQLESLAHFVPFVGDTFCAVLLSSRSSVCFPAISLHSLKYYDLRPEISTHSSDLEPRYITDTYFLLTIAALTFSCFSLHTPQKLTLNSVYFLQVWFINPRRLKIGFVIKDVNRVVDLIGFPDMCHKSLPLEALFADVPAAALPARISFVCL